MQPLPKSWSELTWQQLCVCWQVKQRYGGNADVARTTALLALTVGSKFRISGFKCDERTGESVYTVAGKDGKCWTVTARDLSWMAKQALPWFDYPYGDPGEKEKKDDKGNVVKERREPVSGYVSGMRDAMILQREEVVVSHRHFALPQVAMNNLTWQQYRSLQAIAPMLFQDGIDDGTALNLQAQFIAHCLVPRSFALLDSSGKTIKVRPHWVYEYDATRAEEMVKWWEKILSQSLPVRTRSNCLLRWLPWNRDRQNYPLHSMQGGAGCGSAIFHILFQCYQTALTYYSQAYPLLFADDSKSGEFRDALQGEVSTINTIMKYAGYADQQQVYDSNLPFVLDILNTMAKEAKEIEKMNAMIKKK